ALARRARAILERRAGEDRPLAPADEFAPSNSGDAHERAVERTGNDARRVAEGLVPREGRGVKILFVPPRKNSDPTERELYEMDFMCELLGFRRSLLDLGLITVAACTPADVDVEIADEYTQPIPFDTDADLVALSAKTSCVTRAYEVAR